ELSRVDGIRYQRSERAHERLRGETRGRDRAAEDVAVRAGRGFERALHARTEHTQVEIVQRRAARLEVRLETSREAEAVDRRRVDGRRHGAAQELAKRRARRGLGNVDAAAE